MFKSLETGVRVLDYDLVLTAPFPSPHGWLWVSDHVGLMATLVIDWQTRAEAYPQASLRITI
jgi:hypothetical protein